LIAKIKSYLLNKILTARLSGFKEDQLLKNFMTDMKEVKKILVVTPPQQAVNQTIFLFIKNLKKEFQESKIATFELPMLKKDDVNWLGIPTVAYLSSFKDEKYDLLIDINTDHDIICTFIGAFCNIPMRIHLSAGRFDNIYNLHIRTEENAPLSTRYNTMALYLSKLKQATSQVN